MKRLIIIAVITVSAAWTNLANASIMVPIKHTIQYLITSANFNMSEYEEFTTSNGDSFHLHVSVDKADRVLIMDTSWSPLAELTSSMTEEKGRSAGMEYASSQGVEVELLDADYHYHNGAYGYSFTVKPVVKDN